MSRFECPGCGHNVLDATLSDSDRVECKKCGKIMLPVLLPKDTVISTLPPNFKQMVMLSAAVILAALGAVIGLRCQNQTVIETTVKQEPSKTIKGTSVPTH